MASHPSVTLADRLLRPLLGAAHALLKAGWFIRRPRTFGAHALPLTHEGRIVLVKLRYAPGWRLPGGGRAADEAPAKAVLRELREEIGMTSHGTVQLACELEEPTDFKRDLASLLIVRDVRYTPRRWSWEVERVMEVEPDALPADMSPRMAKWIALLRACI
ncbi:NUDIX domain-containing protein [Sphingomonas sp. GCM10030256]|uniref:NUDIX domain-containing protein n=1 Tax=Sphingomonas sp. GCM10030256 TaxID=3273427 RepID=UPI003612F46E